jgi:hypothetical protein
LKKAAKNACSTGFGLAAEAQPECVKVFWFFFAKKHCFLPRGPLALDVTPRSNPL